MLVKNIKAELNTLLTAWTYFVRIPVPKRLAGTINFSQQSLEKSTRYLSLVGIFVGVASGLSFLVAFELFGDKALAVLISMLASILITGAFHEDGIADFFDAFGGGWWSKKRILEIMKDSRIGTFGSLALIMILLFKFQSLLLIANNQLVAVLIGGHAFSRLAAGTFIFTHKYVRENDESYFKPMIKNKASKRDFITLLIIGVAPLLLLSSTYYLLLIPSLAIIGWLFGRYFTRKIGGYTGDCLGATQQITEVCFYLFFVLITKQLVA
jgi:adenosylcobinamide-GDP ribazoletransferase